VFVRWANDECVYRLGYLILRESWTMRMRYTQVVLLRIFLEQIIDLEMSRVKM